VVPFPLLTLPAQDPAAAAAPDSFWQWLLAFGQQPGVVELLVSSAVIAAVVIVWWRLARLVGGASSRTALQDYLLGVEQALHGDLEGAHERLQKVIAQDPENHYARLLLGKVLADLGEPAQAHKQHLFLQRAFHIDSAENDLLLAQSLLAAGMAGEAAEAAERALQRAPERASGWEFVYRARLQSGDFDAAAAAGKRLLELVRDGERSEQLRTDVAHTFAQSGIGKLSGGDRIAAAAALQHAKRLDDGASGIALLSARLDVAQGGVAATVQALLGDDTQRSVRGDLVPARAGANLPVVAGVAGERLPMATFAGLVPASRWRCRACEVPLDGPVAECPRCRSQKGSVLLEPSLVGPVESPTHTMDAVDENEAYVRRVVRQALEEPGSPARGEVLQLREAAVQELLAQAWQRDNERRDAAIALLREMGPAIAPALFAASDTLEQQRLLPIGSRSPAALVGRVVQGFDRTALPHFASLFASAKPEHRKILIDFFLGLHDLDEFQIVLERFPPLEILHRMNRADAEVLRRFLEAVPEGHFVAETLLLEPTFDREACVLAAIPGAVHPVALERALLRRGASRSLTGELIASLGDARLGATAARLLSGFGEAVIDHVLAAFTDPERDAGDRARLRELLTAAGPVAVERLCLCFGPEPMALDDELCAIVAAMGDAAVLPLQAAFGHSGWVERITIGLISRHTNRRVQIVRTLQAVGTPAAQRALRELLDAERDNNLRLRLQQALHDLATDDTAGGAHGHR
jgi:tetratricopeptide (TPR) repeat protein